MTQKAISVGTAGTPVDMDVNMGNSHDNFSELYGKVVGSAGLSGTTLTITLDDATTVTVDLSELQDGIGTDDQTATEVTFTQYGTISATNVQAAIEELADEKAETDNTAFVMSTLADVAIETTAEPVAGEPLVDDTVAYGDTEDNLRVWSVEKVGSELAGKQDDLAVPTQPEAEAGTATTERVWTAERVKQAIVALGGSGGYTNLTSFVGQTAYRLFYSDADGDVTELALGADSTYLKSNGAGAAPAFATLPTGTSHDALTINATANGLSLSTQELSIGLASTSTIGALSDTDWDTFNNKSNFDGAYSSLSGTPTLFDGAYSSLSGTPSIPVSGTDFDPVGTNNSDDNATNTQYSSLISFDSTSSTKLGTIAEGAEVNVQSDWNASSGDAFIANKPTLFDGAYSSLSGTPSIPSIVQTLDTTGTGETTVAPSEVAVADALALKAPKAIATAVKSAAYTVGTDDANEAYGGVIYTSATGTISLPAIAAGMSLSVIATAAVAVTVDPNGTEKILLDGVDATAGKSIISAGAIGDMAVLTYYGAGTWYAATNSWTAEA